MTRGRSSCESVCWLGIGLSLAMVGMDVQFGPLPMTAEANLKRDLDRHPSEIDTQGAGTEWVAGNKRERGGETRALEAVWRDTVPCIVQDDWRGQNTCCCAILALHLKAIVAPRWWLLCGGVSPETTPPTCRLSITLYLEECTLQAAQQSLSRPNTISSPNNTSFCWSPGAEWLLYEWRSWCVANL